MPPRRAAARGVTWAAFRDRALEMPGVRPATSYGRPALRGRRRTDRYRRYPALVVRLKRLRRDMLARIVEESWRSLEADRW